MLSSVVSAPNTKPIALVLIPSGLIPLKQANTQPILFLFDLIFACLFSSFLADILEVEPHRSLAVPNLPESCPKLERLIALKFMVCWRLSMIFKTPTRLIS